MDGSGNAVVRGQDDGSNDRIFMSEYRFWEE